MGSSLDSMHPDGLHRTNNQIVLSGNWSPANVMQPRTLFVSHANGKFFSVSLSHVDTHCVNKLMPKRNSFFFVVDTKNSGISEMIEKNTPLCTNAVIVSEQCRQFAHKISTPKHHWWLRSDLDDKDQQKLLIKPCFVAILVAFYTFIFLLLVTSPMMPFPISSQKLYSLCVLVKHSLSPRLITAKATSWTWLMPHAAYDPIRDWLEQSWTELRPEWSVGISHLVHPSRQ